LGSVELAIAQLKAGLKHEPYYGTALTTLVAVLVDAGRFKEATGPLQTITEILGNPSLLRLQEQQQQQQRVHPQERERQQEEKQHQERANQHRGKIEGSSLQNKAEGLFKYIFHKGTCFFTAIRIYEVGRSGHVNLQFVSKISITQDGRLASCL
jgi:hypothetical protein